MSDALTGPSLSQAALEQLLGSLLLQVMALKAENASLKAALATVPRLAHHAGVRDYTSEAS